MTHDPIRAILLNELDTVTMALKDIEPPVTQQDLDDLDHWTERLCDANHAFQSLGQVIHVTQQERATLRLILEFFEDNFEDNFEGEEDNAPFDLRAYRALLNKVRPKA